MPRESVFERRLVRELESRFPGCIVLKLDSSQIQGIPDRLLLWGRYWAALEVKRSVKAPHRPNQDYYVTKLNEMGYAAFVYPENLAEVLDEIQHAFRA